MKHSIQGLRDDLQRVQALLSEGSFLSFSSEEKQSLIADSQKYLRKLDSLAEGFLTVGLLGGTGVGKSSLMNALAGSEISSTSHRRPHTDQVLIYRHTTADLPSPLQQTAAPWREIPHQADAIRQILLCDLPDFDSLVGEHRQNVLRFLEHLDVLVWVTSPEKYADERFYAFLGDAPKAKQNFYFVLNKADLFFQEQSLSTGYDQLAKVTRSFLQHLSENGVSHPLIYTLSAEEIIRSHPPSPWNQFSSFRDQIFQQRDVKEVMTIKAANLDVEVQQLLAVLKQEIFNLEMLRRIVNDFIEKLEEEREEWTQAGQDVFRHWSETYFKRGGVIRLIDPAPLAGPGYLVALVMQEWRGWMRKESEKDRLSNLFPEGGVSGSLQRRFELLENRMAHQLLRQGLPAPFVRQLESALDAKHQWQDLLKRLQHYLEMRLSSYRAPSFWGYRLVQYATYLLLFLFLLLALAGETAWRGFLAQPDWSGFASLISVMIQNLYSPRGLAALGSYILLNVFFAFRFYARYKKILQRRTQKFIESLKRELERLWEEELDAVIAQLSAFSGELDAQISAISALHDTRKRD